MTINRRRMIGGAVALAGVGLPPIARSRGEELGSGGDATAALRRAIDAATRAGRPVVLPEGTLRSATLRLPDGARLVGSPGATRLTLVGGGPLVAAESGARVALSGLTFDGARLVGSPGATRLTLVGGGPLVAAESGARVALSGLTFDGADRRLDDDKGLLDFSAIAELSISDCVIERAGGVGVSLRGCGGRIERNGVRDVAAGGVFSTDATGLVIADNRVERCRDNGIQVWRTTRGDDGTRVSGNRVSDIKNVSGGSGQYGNGISLFRAGGVVVAGNTIRRCAYSAVRNNGGAGVVISGNTCADLGETAIFAEFEFEGCVIADNAIDGAVCGVQMVNFADHGGRAAVCSGNVIRNLKSSQGHSGHEFGYECGVKVEADATVSGNVIEGAPWVGVLVGWGASLRDVAVVGNVVRDAPIGVGVSIVEGVGGAVIADNVISGASRGAVLGMNFDEPGTADLARSAAAPPQLRVSGNQAT